MNSSSLVSHKDALRTAHSHEGKHYIPGSRSDLDSLHLPLTLNTLYFNRLQRPYRMDLNFQLLLHQHSPFPIPRNLDQRATMFNYKNIPPEVF